MVIYLAFSNLNPFLFYRSLVDFFFFFTVFFPRKRFPSRLIAFWWKIVFWVLEVLICYLVDIFLFVCFFVLKMIESSHNLHKRELHCKDILRDFGGCESKVFPLFSNRLNSADFMVKENASQPRISSHLQIGIFSGTSKNRGKVKTKRGVTHFLVHFYPFLVHFLCTKHTLT